MSAQRLTLDTDPIELTVEAGTPITIRHGLGRQVNGWLCVWSTAPVIFHVADPRADTARELVLVPSNSARVRLVLL